MKFSVALFSVLAALLGVSALPQDSPTSQGGFNFQPQSTTAFLRFMATSVVTSVVTVTPTSLYGSVFTTTHLVTQTPTSLPETTNTASQQSQSQSGLSRQTIIIITCAVSIAIILVLTISLVFFYRKFRNEKPLRDEEISRWKSISRHSRENSNDSKGKRPDSDEGIYTHVTMVNSYSAPNAKAGLTDATIPGQPAFLPIPPRRSSSKLKKGSHPKKSASKCVHPEPALEDAEYWEPTVPPPMPAFVHNAKKDSFYHDRRSVMSLMQKW